MRFGSTVKVLLKCKLKYYRISECTGMCAASQVRPCQVRCFFSFFWLLISAERTCDRAGAPEEGDILELLDSEDDEDFQPEADAGAADAAGMLRCLRMQVYPPGISTAANICCLWTFETPAWQTLP